MVETSSSNIERWPRRPIPVFQCFCVFLILSILVVACGPIPTPAPAPTATPTSPPPTGPVIRAKPTWTTPTPAPLAGLEVFPQTEEPLQVLVTQPADGAEGVPVSRDEFRVVVQFNHPVVPLTTIEEQEGLPHPLIIEPAIEGTGHWLNTSTYEFRPTQDLKPSTQYTARIAAGLKDVLGAELREDVVWGFTSAYPAVTLTVPEDDALYVGTTRPITVTFNQPMDHASAEAAFTLRRVDGEEVRGHFEWDGNNMVFWPDQPLEYATRYEAVVAAGAKAATADEATRADYHWTFTTTEKPAVVSTYPEDGAQETKAVREGFQITFSAPMDPEALQVTIQPTITNQNIYFSDSETKARIWGGWQASTAYTVTIKAESPSRYGDPLGQDVVVRFTTAPLDPQFFPQVRGDMGFYDAGRTPVLYATVINVPEVEFRLYRVGRDDLIRLTGEDRWRVWEKYSPPPENLVRQWTVTSEVPLNATQTISTTLSVDPEGTLDPGAYWLTAHAEGVWWTPRQLVIVSELNLAYKRTETEALVWATGLATGEPVADQPIAIYDHQGKLLASGVTDQDGVFRAEFPRQDFWHTSFVISEVDGKVVAAVGSEWGDGIGPWDFNLPFNGQQQDYYANLYTDRAIYRPGQTVYFKGILRTDDDAVYSLPDLESVPITIRDSQGKEILKSDFPLSPFGTFHGSVDLSPAAPLGYYSIELQLGPEERRFYSDVSFLVAAYRRPEFQVEVSTDRPEYVHGDTINVDVKASYFFGGPVADAKVQWRLLSDDFFFKPENVKGWWDWADYDFERLRFFQQQGEVLSEGQGTTDAEGHFTFQIPADVSEFPLSQVFTVDVEVTDINNQAVSNRASAVVHKGHFYIGLQPQEYVGRAGEELGVNVLTVDPQGEPVGNQPLRAKVYRREWFSARQKREDGGFYWTSTYTDTLLTEIELTTDEEGEGVIRFTPKQGGVHRVVAEGTDQEGNTVTSATYVWVSGREFVNWRQENNDRIELVADKKTYKVGDIAEVLVPAPFAGAQALVTVERGHIKLVRRVKLAGNSETIGIPILPDYAPNVYVSVMLVKGVGPDSPTPQFKIGYTNLQVSVKEKLLDVTVRPDRLGPYKPGDTVTYDVEVRDRAGNGVEAELSLALVDKAIQSLAEETAQSPVEAFYGQRALAVSTAASLVRSVDRISQQLTAAAKGGGGGLQALEVGPVRRVFRDTAYWNPALVTDADGRAQVSVTLPDNLTTWNMTAKGVTRETLVGVGQVDIISTKPVLVRPVTPRFFVVGDQVRLEAVVNNNTDQSVTVDLSLSAEGLTLLPPPDRGRAGEGIQSLTVPAGGKAKVGWEVSVDDVEQVMATFAAEGHGYQDAVELTLPVYRYSTPETVATAGQVETRIVEQIKVPSGVDTTQGELTVEVNPSLAAASRDSLSWLESFPWECSEQTVSKFLPNVATYRALKELGLDRPELRAHLEDVVSRQIQRLYALQHPDGGWGWWLPDESQPWLTAYALFGLYTAREAGFAVDEEVMTRAVEYLLQYLGRPVDVEQGWDYNQRALVLFAMAESGYGDLGRTVTLFDKRSNLSNYGKALVAMALQKLGGPEQDARLKTLVTELTGVAILSATGAHWEEQTTDHRLANTNTRTTAMVMEALARIDPQNPLLPNAVRWLMVARKEGHWETTQETAWSVLALTDWMRSTSELQAGYTYRVQLNGQTLGEGQVTPENVDQPARFVVPVQELLLDVANELVMTRQGQGRLYYAAYLRTFQPVERIRPLDRGIIVGRQYFKVDPRTLEPTGEPALSARVGDVVQVKLTIVAPSDLHYLVVEDPLPAGFEAIDTSLKTVSAAARGPEFQEVIPDEQLPWWMRPWWSYWTHSDLRDEKVALFATQLGRGTYEYTYLMRASVAGQFNVMPTVAYEMYFPEVFGRSAGGTFSVEQ